MTSHFARRKAEAEAEAEAEAAAEAKAWRITYVTQLCGIALLHDLGLSVKLLN